MFTIDQILEEGVATDDLGNDKYIYYTTGKLGSILPLSQLAIYSFEI